MHFTFDLSFYPLSHRAGSIMVKIVEMDERVTLEKQLYTPIDVISGIFLDLAI
jgi:hypothetical protein